jgi:dienelactone hydrolase
MAPGGCCTPPPPADYEGKGKEESWEGIDVYTVGSSVSYSAVLFITDVYGWRVPQTRYLADKIAAHGHYVAIPDLMHSDFYQATDPSDEFAGLPIYLPKHPIPEARVEAARVLEQLQAKGFKKIGVLGNCWGAKIIISLLFGDKGVDAGVMQHPSFLTKEEIAAVKIPLAILGASIDVITPPAMAEEFGEILKASPEVGDKYYVKVFPDVEHGFTTRYDLKDEAAHLKACEAHDEMLAWFAKYLA